jgi:hypothetical protein
MKKKLALIFSLIFLNFNLLFSQCYINEIPSYGTPLSTTGNSALDNLLITESIKMEVLFGVKIDLYAYDDSYSSNALAHGHTIMMGKTLMLEELLKYGTHRSIVAIMAHEFAHIVQHEYNLNYKGDWVGKYPELHADFLAGWYIGKTNIISDRELQNLGVSFWDKGDEHYYSPDSHGSKYERCAAFFAGYRNSNKNIYDAFYSGTNFVANIERNISQSSILNNSESQVSLSKDAGYLCIYNTSYKNKRTKLFLNNVYVGKTSKVFNKFDTSPAYGKAGTLSLPLNPGKYTLSIYKKILFGCSIKFKYLYISEKGSSIIDIGND